MGIEQDKVADGMMPSCVVPGQYTQLTLSEILCPKKATLSISAWAFICWAFFFLPGLRALGGQEMTLAGRL